MAAHMKTVFEAMYKAGFKGLQQHLEARSWSADPVKPIRIPQPCPLCAAAPFMQLAQHDSELEDSASTGSCCSQSGPQTWPGHMGYTAPTEQEPRGEQLLRSVR